MTPASLARLKELQEQWARTSLAPAEQAELFALRRELDASPEVADDPATWLVDESRRPLTTGGDYNDTLHAMTCAELEAIATRVGTALFRAAADAVLAKL